jgi:NAD(P)-dependent dehydrogenase (short-subunit alcohol dehydrogenase family)
MRELREKVAVITGAGCGIGRALAENFAGLGCHLALVDIGEERLGQVAEVCGDKGARVTTHVADVRDRTRMQALPDEVVEAHGGVQILVNNAGVTAWATVEEMDLEDFDWVLEVNLRGVLHGCKFFLPHLLTQPEAHIVNVSSLFGILAVRRQAAYCASKYAVRGFTEALDAELDGTSVDVSIVHPGGVATNFIVDSRTKDPEARNEFADLVASYSSKPEKVARTIVKVIQKKKLRARVGPDAFVGDWLKRAFPTGGQRLLARFLAKSMP